MTEFIKNVVIIVIGLIAGFIASAYVFYFVGMTMSLTAGIALGMEGEALAQIFAWIGVGIAAAIFVMISAIAIKDANEAKAVHISTEEFERMFGREDDN